MSVRRFRASASALVLAAVTALGLANPASAAGTTASTSAGTAAVGGYVALGDSYSSGVGAGSYIADSGDCRRSTLAYPYLWAAKKSPSSFAFVACAGATSASVAKSQLSALRPSTALVSVTVGGNDVGYADVMRDCVLSTEATCLKSVKTAVSRMNKSLPSGLDSLYRGIHAKAPRAHVVVLGYPRFYHLGGGCAAGLSEAERSAINRAADVLNGVLAKRAADIGFTYSSVVDEFTGHEICSRAPWLRSVAFPVHNSYHPNASGQAHGYLPALRSAL
ncbi:SGNH/GDSL hydrolase family protein [Streptomyces sp. AM 4-1-1]|uniref:SGNH/GDSL hydrolase family protein n=1 Tax=Streptomyces sp. AM 4-1-1 TaxID=3028710 RepID=UPI0023B9CFF0|nr:SGNH/GDSL hydrolase family protein [Streptomyces sp. AM 4-1-1]WEH34941.1 SGNH/GDSL hydrolase family protein [Streptomyces sp. AM 4-1-1]